MVLSNSSSLHRKKTYGNFLIMASSNFLNNIHFVKEFLYIFKIFSVILYMCCLYRSVYNARKHPKFMNGEWTEAECFKHFLATFEAPEEKDGKVNVFCKMQL